MFGEKLKLIYIWDRNIIELILRDLKVLSVRPDVQKYFVMFSETQSIHMTLPYFVRPFIDFFANDSYTEEK